MEHVGSENDEDKCNSANDGSSEMGMPRKKYILVCLAMKATGNRLIDEILQIVAYTPNHEFSQCIMPFGNLNPACKAKLSVRVVTVGKMRLLQDTKAKRFIKTKSVVPSMKSFLSWLENVRGVASDGIIFLYYEGHKSTPHILLETLRRYDLLERFTKTVKGFANGFSMAQTKCSRATNVFKLQFVAKSVLFQEGMDFANLLTRTRTIFELVTYWATGDMPDENEYKGTEAELLDFVCPFINPIRAEQDEIGKLKLLLQLQGSLRPIFGKLLRASSSERQVASRQRRILVERKLDYSKLKDNYSNGGKDSLKRLLEEECTNVEKEELEELIELLDCFFNPEKKAIKPKATIRFRRSTDRSQFAYNRNSNYATRSNFKSSLNN